MACHPELTRRLKIDIWFADPHAPWQRGSNENTNGLLRQFMPKGTDLSDASQTWLNDVARFMNGRARHWGGKAQPKPWPKKSRPSDQTLHLQAESKLYLVQSQRGAIAIGEDRVWPRAVRQDRERRFIQRPANVRRRNRALDQLAARQAMETVAQQSGVTGLEAVLWTGLD